MEKIRVFGAGVRAALVANLISWQFVNRFLIEGYYCDQREKGTLGPLDRPILGTVANGLKEVLGDGISAFVAIGTRSAALGCEVFLELEANRIPLPTLISPSSHVFPSAKIGLNGLVLPGAYVGCNVCIGHLFCAHGGSIIEHDCRIGHNVLLGPGAAIASSVCLGSHCFLGAGATVIPEVTIGCGTFVGAGSVVTRDVPPNVVAYGQPVVMHREVNSADELPTKDEIEQLARRGLT